MIKPITDKHNPDYRPPGYREKDDFIALVTYDKNWPILAEQEIASLHAILPSAAILDIQHIGSTAIPGAIAKPVIDIQIAVKKLAAIKPRAIKAIEEIGYLYWYGNPDPERMLFMKGLPPYGKQRTHHVHIVEKTHHQWRDKLFFRDYLRTHSETLVAYIELKQQLAEKYRYDREAYTQGKSEFVRQVLAGREE